MTRETGTAGGKQMLILTYFTNEEGMACSHHIDDRLPFFRKNGYEPVILSSLCAPRHRDYIHYRVPSMFPSGIRFELRRSFLRGGRDRIVWRLRNMILLPLMPFFALERMVFKADATWSWLPPALLRANRICRSGNIDCIYSTGGPPVVHEVARRVKRRFALKWLAETQDPLIHSYCTKENSELQLLRKVEKETYARADRMIFLTRAAMAGVESRIGRTGNGTVIYPGAEKGEIQAPARRGRETLMAHFGSLGGVRNLQPLIRGVELAARENRALTSMLKIDLYGNIGEDDRQRLGSSFCRPVFTVKGLVPRREGIQVMRRYDFLLLIQGIDEISTETIPSKLYEYLHSGRPVLGLTYRNPELDAMLNGLGHVPVPADDAPGIAEALNRLLRDVQDGGRRKPESSPFTAEKAVRQLLALL